MLEKRLILFTNSNKYRKSNTEYRSHEPMYLTDKETEAKRLKATTFVDAIVAKAIIMKRAIQKRTIAILANFITWSTKEDRNLCL